MRKRKPDYLKCIVIVHGKSEKQICSYIKSKLRFHMDIISRNNGESSIQINGLTNFMNSDSRLKDINGFLKAYEDAEYSGKGKKRTLASYFKIFTIMDTDDCSDEQREKYINKEMFKKHWAYDYIVPIFNTPELESVMVKAGIHFTKKGEERKKEYIKIFPTSQKYTQNESIELNHFACDLKKVKNTNLDEFIEYCLDKSESYV